jgi:hypothetical protein
VKGIHADSLCTLGQESVFDSSVNPQKISGRVSTAAEKRFFDRQLPSSILKNFEIDGGVIEDTCIKH